MFLIIPLLLFISCESYIGKDCTAEFRIIGVAVYAVDDNPVVLDEFTVTTREFQREIELDICGNGYDCENGKPPGRPEQGIYTIFHDGMKNAIRLGSIQIKVAGRNEQVQFEEEFIISSDGCHVVKESGPDTVIVDVS